MTEPNGKSGPGARGPRVYQDKPTLRERVLCESLAKKVKELTGREVSTETARAFRFTYSRWYADPATRELMQGMSSQIKRAKAQEKREKALAELREAEAELGDVESDIEDDDETDEDTNFDDDEDDDEDVFDSDKVKTSF